MPRPGASAPFLYIDPSTAGISGNMLVGALLDAMPVKERAAAVTRLRRAFGREGFRLAASEVRRHGFRGFFVDSTDIELETRDLKPEIRKAAKALRMAKRPTSYAESVADLLVALEAEVHGVPRLKVHLHELAGYDTVFDAVAGAWALDKSGAFAGGPIFSRPVEVGSGTVSFSHGTTPVPAPVSELILHRFAIPFSQHGDRELATPTGLAMLAMLRPSFGPPPPSVLLHRGVGAGSFDLPDRPNLLHVQVRRRLDASPAYPVHDPVAELEVNLDDLTGEEAGHALSTVLAEGALDAHLVHTLAKKGRPGYVLNVLSREEDAERLAGVVGSLTGSWGVRVSSRVLRFKRVPETATVRVRLGAGRKPFDVRVKYIRDETGFARVKAEHGDAAAAAEASGESLSRVKDLAEAAVRSGAKPRRSPR